MFGLRESQSSFRNRIQSKIEDSIGCTKGMSMGEKYNNFCCYQNMLGELQNIAENSIDSIVRPIINRFESSISKTLQDILPDESVSFFNGIHKGYYQVFIEKWPKTVHFEFIPFDNIKLLSGKVYSLVLHVENKDLQQKFSDLLEKEEIANKAKDAGINFVHRDRETPLFYEKNIEKEKPFAEMGLEELIDSLKNLFSEGKQIVSFVSENLLKN